MKNYFLLFIILFFLGTTGYGQKRLRINTNPKQARQDSLDRLKMITHSFSRNLPPNRTGSGTSWVPDKSPIYAYLKTIDQWNFMMRGNRFFRINRQDIFNAGSRGVLRLDAPNWFMVTGQRKIKTRGLFSFNVRVSLDHISIFGRGYPLLFQTGRNWNGQPLTDTQHPQDVLNELSVGYSHAISPSKDIYMYLAYPGDPALGPPAYLLRPSAMYISDPPLGYRYQDGTHASFGVATMGYRYKIMKAEISSFTGRLPNTEFLRFEKPRFDSYSARISVNPTGNFALQVSHGFIKSPEVYQPLVDVRRTTASVLYSRILGENHYLNTALIGGMDNNGQNTLYSGLAEASLQLNKWAIYSRYEQLQKTAGQLAVPMYNPATTFNISAFTLGGSYTLLSLWNTYFIAGLQATVNKTGPALESIYGHYPVSGQAYLRIIPANLKMTKEGLLSIERKKKKS